MCLTRPEALGFKVLGFRALGFRALGLRALGFKVLGFRALGFRALGLRALGFKVFGFQPCAGWCSECFTALHRASSRRVENIECFRGEMCSLLQPRQLRRETFRSN